MTKGIPNHIAVIMDGNGRWAKARRLPRAFGHRKGAEALRELLKAAIDIGIPYMTFYSFSSENWSRPQSEIEDIMGLLRRYLQSELATFHQAGIRLKVIGERSRLAKDIVQLIDDAEKQTAENDKMTVVMALSYGGRQEIVEASRQMAIQVLNNELSPDDITEELFGKSLYTKDIPDPDLLIRTSGEMRISNFLLWQLAYSEMVFVEKNWPDFTRDDLLWAIEEYQKRDRRYGAAAETG
ncbi:isoprenyl transferase [Kiloniella laminariae]|uniref:Isoprenyl transferase n=1 Tax=Kiloniella laminariae TaxID=454162 RepID=A0ABT4LLP6_9PROT|nr:isoprenyl transferase [Kiloniella laminariae]MCZ4282026.1 isoprenyl transferase [Kiloniella laminariae]